MILVAAIRTRLSSGSTNVLTAQASLAAAFGRRGDFLECKSGRTGGVERIFFPSTTAACQRGGLPTAHLPQSFVNPTAIERQPPDFAPLFKCGRAVGQSESRQKRRGGVNGRYCEGRAVYSACNAGWQTLKIGK